MPVPVLDRLNEIIYTVERGAPDEPSVRGAVILGERYTIVFDTLYSPRDMVPVLALAGGRRRPILVINSHADYDHAWGNAAFPGVPIIGHAACRERLLVEGDALLEKQREDPEEYATSSLVPPDLVFTDTMRIDAGGFTVVLHHLPGHTRDCLVAHIPEHRLLLAGDCAETPIPLLNDGPLDGWIAALRGWADPALVETVVSSHGPISGIALLRRNADYLESLRHGNPDEAAPGAEAPPFYREAHRRNVARAAALRGRGETR